MGLERATHLQVMQPVFTLGMLFRNLVISSASPSRVIGDMLIIIVLTGEGIMACRRLV